MKYNSQTQNHCCLWQDYRVLCCISDTEWHRPAQKACTDRPHIAAYHAFLLCTTLITAYVIFVDGVPKKSSFYLEFSSSSRDDTQMHHTLSKPYRFYNTWQSPLCAEQTVAVQPPPVVKASVEDIYSYYTWVHWVGVLSHSSFDHCIPGVPGERGDNHLWLVWIYLQAFGNPKSGLRLS